MPANLGGFFFFFRRKAPVVIMVYDLFEITESKNIIKRSINKIRFSKIINKANKIITISKESGNSIESIFPNAYGKVVPVYLFVDKNSSDCSDMSIASRVKQVVDKNPYILANGSGQIRKNASFLIQNIKNIYSDFGLNLILIGKDFYNNNYQTIFQEIELSHCETVITHLGEVTDQELKYLYKHAKCFIFPSLAEGFGLPPLEALSCECKIAVSNIPIFKEIYSGMDCLFEFNYDSLKETLSNIFNEDIDVFNKKKEVLLARFSYERFSQELLNLFAV
jgi:glycosyltransferase involved in cell wall biosynthesis